MADLFVIEKMHGKGKRRDRARDEAFWLYKYCQTVLDEFSHNRSNS
jgi:hypothetical protein